jgi:hypothetical protein
MDALNIVLYDLPVKVRAFTRKNEDDSYTIFINARLNNDQQHHAYQHEVKHISEEHFGKYLNVNNIEYDMHLK